MHKLFPSQLDDEKIYVVIRQHWMVLAGKLVIWFMFAAALVLFRRFGEAYLPGLFEGDIGTVTALFMQIYSLFLVLALFIIWLLYYLNIQVITDRRIVDIDQVGLFSHVVSELHIANIEDVTSETNGVFGTLFNFGMVYVQTAGNTERFEFDNCPDPEKIEKLILSLYDKIPASERAHVRTN